jgi:DNA-binding MarR family transcriptional regulator
MERALTLADYESLAELRYQIRRFLQFSKQAAFMAGLEPQQHQLMLSLKGLPRNMRPRIGELAERMQVRHHSAVELVNRLSIGGYVRRHHGSNDGREVLLSLTPKGERVLKKLSLQHRAELRMCGPVLLAALRRVLRTTKSGKAVPSRAVSRAVGFSEKQAKTFLSSRTSLQKKNTLTGRAARRTRESS